MATNPVKGVDSQATASQGYEWTLKCETLIFLLISRGNHSVFCEFVSKQLKKRKSFVAPIQLGPGLNTLH